jgi:hypothetical protein
MPYERDDAGLVAFEAAHQAAGKSEIPRLPSLTTTGSLPDTSIEGGSVRKVGMVTVNMQVREEVPSKCAVQYGRALPLEPASTLHSFAGRHTVLRAA